MGYHVDYRMSVQIKPENFHLALAAINQLHTPGNLHAYASGGSFGGGMPRQHWYAWVRNPEPGGFKSLEEALEAWRFSTWLRDDRTLGLYFRGEKLGDEEHLFKALTPYWEGEIYAHGEDGEQWGYRFRDGRMITLHCEWVEDAA